MANKRYILGVFDDDDVLLTAVKNIRSAGTEISEVYTPFPVHGLDHAMGLKNTRLHSAGFLFGATGFFLMLLYIFWISAKDYPSVFGGKPFFAFPAYVPVLFEVTVLSAAVGMVIVYFVRNKLNPLRQTPVLDTRITNDKFVISFEVDETPEEKVVEIKALLEKNGASEVNEKIID